MRNSWDFRRVFHFTEGDAKSEEDVLQGGAEMHGGGIVD